MTKIIIYTDGGSRGNPGPAALGVYIEDGNGKELARIGKTLGINTNNFAEYSAIIEGLSWAVENKEKLKIETITFYMDSQLACSQLNGLYKVKSENIRVLFFSVKQKEAYLNLPIYYNHIPREQNKKADYMVNLALDNNL
jgi:ribonuclease HI